MDFVTFALTMALGQFTPGPDMLVILKNTLNHGFRAACFTIIGISLGILGHITLAFVGLSRLVETAPAAFRFVQWAGAAYLVFIAFQLIRSSSASPSAVRNGGVAASEPALLDDGAAFREGLLTNLLNAKVLLFFSSVLAPMVEGAGKVRLVYALIIMAEVVLLWPLFAWIMRSPYPRAVFFRNQALLNHAFAAFLLLIAVRFVL